MIAIMERCDQRMTRLPITRLPLIQIRHGTDRRRRHRRGCHRARGRPRDRAARDVRLRAGAPPAAGARHEHAQQRRDSRRPLLPAGNAQGAAVRRGPRADVRVLRPPRDPARPLREARRGPRRARDPTARSAAAAGDRERCRRPGDCRPRVHPGPGAGGQHPIRLVVPRQRHRQRRGPGEERCSRPAKTKGSSSCRGRHSSARIAIRRG